MTTTTSKITLDLLLEQAKDAARAEGQAIGFAEGYTQGFDEAQVEVEAGVDEQLSKARTEARSKAVETALYNLIGYRVGDFVTTRPEELYGPFDATRKPMLVTGIAVSPSGESVFVDLENEAGTKNIGGYFARRFQRTTKPATWRQPKPVPLASGDRVVTTVDTTSKYDFPLKAGKVGTVLENFCHVDGYTLTTFDGSSRYVRTAHLALAPAPKPVAEPNVDPKAIAIGDRVKIVHGAKSAKSGLGFQHVGATGTVTKVPGYYDFIVETDQGEGAYWVDELAPVQAKRGDRVRVAATYFTNPDMAWLIGRTGKVAEVDYLGGTVLALDEYDQRWSRLLRIPTTGAITIAS